MKPGSISAVALSGLVGLMSSSASALPLPDNSSCSSSGSGSCLIIQNTSTGKGIHGGAQSSEGVTGASVSGVGVFAFSNHGVALRANAHGNANSVFATTSSSIASAIYGENWSTGGQGITARTQAAGLAIVGDNPSSSGWAGYFTGRVFAQSGVTTGSDARLKRDIKALHHGLQQLQALRPVAYRLKAPDDKRVHLGLIAQELQKTLPEVVTSDPRTGMLAVDYDALIPVTIKGIQEQQQLIDRQQQLIDRQEQRLARLEARAGLTTSSMLGGGMPGWLALGIAPLGLVALFRRRGRDDRHG